MRYLRWLLFPFSLVYGLVVIIRNWIYDTGLFKSRKFDIPVIGIGNLEIGGAGKSPMAEYLIRLLKINYKTATLSRGYGRKTKGFLIAEANAAATDAGDEPAQFKQKFPEVTVAVSEDRAAGIDLLREGHDLIILDDAFQHRAVRPGLNILLFDYHHLRQTPLLLPAGNLREPFSGKRRADVIVVTKCPVMLTEQQQAACYKRIKPLKRQPLFFSAIKYQPLQDMRGRPVKVNIDKDTTVFLLTGIANPKPLVQYLKDHTSQIIHHHYPDHHQFSIKNITKLAGEFAACSAQKKMIITTEKDAQRLGIPALRQTIAPLPVIVLPIGILFLNGGQQAFNQSVLNYVREHTKHNQLY